MEGSGRGVVDKGERGRKLPPCLLFPPPSGRALLEVSSWPGTWAAALRVKPPAPQLSLCSRNSRGRGRGAEVVYLGGRWRRGVRAGPGERGSAGGAPVPLTLSFFGGSGAPVPPGLVLSGSRGQRFAGTSTW